MKKNMLLALALAACVFVKANAAEVANTSPVPKKWSGIVEGLTYQGVKPIRVHSSASAVLLHTGPGFVDAVCPFMGTAGNYTMLFDAVAADGASTLANGPTSTGALSYSLTPPVFTAGATAATLNGYYSLLPGQGGCWVPPAPVKFVNGLYSMANATGHEALVYAHCSDGSNPCVMP